jgi:endonuclease I
MKFKSLLFLIASILIQNIYAQHSITNLATNYTQDFNSLANSGSTSSTLPANWYISNATYSVGTGSSNSGQIYSFGLAGSTDRALGSLGSNGNQNGKFGMNFTNNTSSNILSLTISYKGEMWRLGSGFPLDTLYFSYSTDASSISNGTWTEVDQLRFLTPDTSSAFGAVDGNSNTFSRSVSYTITGLNIAPGASFWIRWHDFNSPGNDDGLSIDDLTVSYTGAVLPACITPTNNATVNSLSSTITEITGSFNKASGSQKTLVVYSTSSTLSSNPTNTNSYLVGQALGGGTVAFVGAASTGNINLSGLSSNTLYHFFFFPFNDSCSGGPVYKTTSIKTDTIRTKRQPIIAPYYSTVDTNLTCDAFKTALKNRILNNHVPITYTQVLTAFASTDISSGNNIVERYSNCQFTYTTAPCSGNSDTCQCYNRDHVVPQSWFGDWDNYPMYSDMHHIFPSDGYINSAKKGNLPVGIVNGAGSYSNSAGVKVGNSAAANGFTGEVFEPGNQYKGDFARAYLYFVTRYQDSIANFETRFPSSPFNSANYTGLDKWILKILVQWHKQDPPSSLEIFRNDSVYRIQGNRNPYIDYPQWVEKVFGTNGDACGLYADCTQPTAVPTNLTFTSITKNSISGKFNKPVGGADGYVILYRKGSQFIPNLRDSSNYNIGQLVTNSYPDSAYVADTSLNANDTTFTISGLDSSSLYWIAIVPFNNCDYGKNYNNTLTTNVNRNDTTTAGVVATSCGDPTQLPTNLVLHQLPIILYLVHLINLLVVLMVI